MLRPVKDVPELVVERWFFWGRLEKGIAPLRRTDAIHGLLWSHERDMAHDGAEEGVSGYSSEDFIYVEAVFDATRRALVRAGVDVAALDQRDALAATDVALDISESQAKRPCRPRVPRTCANIYGRVSRAVEAWARSKTHLPRAPAPE